jgi:AcrR family transcriptional regulator
MAVPIRRRQEDRTALSDQMLKQAAVNLLVERGIPGTTLAAIGERAGYSRGLVTHRFGSKAGLLAYVHDTVAASWIGRVQVAVGNKVGVEALLRAADALHGFIVEAPNEIRAMYLLRYASIDPGSEYRANVAKVHKAQQRDVQRWIEAGQATGGIASGVRAALAAELFCAALDGLLYRWLVNPDIPIDELHRKVRREVQRAFVTRNAMRNHKR